MKVVVFASGTGSNARNIFALAQKHPELIEVCALISNKSDAGALAIAKEFEIESYVVPLERKESKLLTRVHHEERICEILDEIDFDYICLAGYMRIFTKDFVQKYPHPEWPVSKIINIHPALLPSFKGHSGYEDAFDYGVKISGVTTHFVNEEVDGGSIIHQRSFERYHDDTLQKFKKRGLEEEYVCYRQTLLALATKDIHISSTVPFRLHVSLSEEKES